LNGKESKTKGKSTEVLTPTLLRIIKNSLTKAEFFSSIKSSVTDQSMLQNNSLN
jgi:hypothetical protein